MTVQTVRPQPGKDTPPLGTGVKARFICDIQLLVLAAWFGWLSHLRQSWHAVAWPGDGRRVCGGALTRRERSCVGGGRTPRGFCPPPASPLRPPAPRAPPTRDPPCVAVLAGAPPLTRDIFSRMVSADGPTDRGTGRPTDATKPSNRPTDRYDPTRQTDPTDPTDRPTRPDRPTDRLT